MSADGKWIAVTEDTNGSVYVHGRWDQLIERPMGQGVAWWVGPGVKVESGAGHLGDGKVQALGALRSFGEHLRPVTGAAFL